MDQAHRHAMRAFRANPGLAAMAVVMLALGIGASTAMFSVVDAVLLRPLPYADSDRLVWVWSIDARRSLQQWVSFPDFLDWRERTRTLDYMSGWGAYELTLSGPEPRRVRAGLVSDDFFALVGASALLGTTDAAGEQRVVLSHGFWQRSFGGDPALIGRGVTLSGRLYTVTGVMPPEFRFPIQFPADLWMVVRNDQFNPALRNRRDARLIEVMGRLRPGITVEQAQADMAAIAGNLRSEYPVTNVDMGVRVVPALEQVTGRFANVLWVLFGAVGCVLAIACANVANVLMAGAVRRRPELALRMALGAGRRQIVRQLTIECLPLVAAGGGLGCVLSVWILQILVSVAPADLPRADGIGVDVRVLAFAVAASLMSLLMVALAPAWRASNPAAGSVLQFGLATASPGRRSRRVLDGLVIVQMAAAMILLAGAALLVNSFMRLSQDDSGYDPRNVLTFRLDWPTPLYGPVRAAQTFQKLQERLEALPGVQTASIGLQLPDRGEPMLDRDLPFVRVDGRATVRSQRLRTAVLTVQPRYFRTLGIPLVSGRDFDGDDRPGSRPVVIINQSLARASFGDEDPLGHQLRLDGWSFLGERSAEIIGVAGDVKHRHLGADATPLVYLPLTQNPVTSASVVMKTSGDPLRLAGPVRDAVRSMDPDQPIDDVQTLEQRLALSLAQDRFSAWVLGLFAAAALVLAVGGLYAVLSYIVEQRMQELGIRVALGARTRDVLGLVLRDGLRTMGVGIAAGVGGGLAVSRVIERLLFGVSATDPFTFAVAALVLGAAGLLACWTPVRRATTVDPITVLR